jgi:O-antigen ligase
MEINRRKLELKKLIVWFIASLSALLYVYILYFSISSGLEVYVFGFFLSLPFLFLIIKFPKIWIYSVILLFVPMLVFRDIGVSVFEVLFAIISVTGLFYFFFYKTLIEKKRIVFNYGDLSILSFFILMPFNILFALANDVDLLRWLREVLIIALILYYFPIREYFTTEKEFKTLLVIVGIASLITIVGSLAIFQQKVLQQAIYVYQLAKSVLVNQTLFSATIFASIVFFLYQKKIIIRIFLLTLAGAATLALIATYTRTNWVIAIFVIFTLFFMVKRKEKLRLVTILFFASSIITLTSFLLFKENAKFFFRILETRFESTSQMREDKSVAARIAEYPTVLRGISENPLWGNGFAKTIRFRDPIHVRTAEGEIIHNGYAFFIYRGGIPLAILYFVFFFYYTFKSLLLTFKTSEPFTKSLALSALLIFVSLLIANLTGPQFIHREGIFTIMITVSMIEFAAQKNDEKAIQKG